VINVIPVKTEKELKSFIDFPYQLYKNNRYWVPPLKRDVFTLFNKKKYPFWEHSERELFLAYRDNRLAGRVCAIIDYNYIEFWNEKVGYFGFFECDDDVEAAKALFDEVTKFHREKGMKKFIGPMNPSTNDECGFLLEGYFSPPMIMMTYNPEYYHKLVEYAGLKKAKDLYAYYIDLRDAPLDRLERLASIIRKRVRDMKVRPVNLKDFNNEVKKIKEIYNEAWSYNWGFVPMTDAEFDFLAKYLKDLVVPELVLIIEIDNFPAAVSIAVPDYNLVLKKMNGQLGPIGIFKFLYYKNKIKEGRLMTMGVRRQFRKLGLEALLFLESFKAGQKLGYVGGELSWTLEDNYVTNNTIQKMGGKLYKKYRLCEGYVQRQEVD